MLLFSSMRMWSTKPPHSSSRNSVCFPVKSSSLLMKFVRLSLVSFFSWMRDSSSWISPKSCSTFCVLQDYFHSSCWHYSYCLSSPKSSFLSPLYQNPDYRTIVKAKRKGIPGDCQIRQISWNPFISGLFQSWITLLLTEEQPSPHGSTRHEVRLT